MDPVWPRGDWSILGFSRNVFSFCPPSSPTTFREIGFFPEVQKERSSEFPGTRTGQVIIIVLGAVREEEKDGSQLGEW